MELNKKLNKTYVINIYESLLILEGYGVYEPGQQKDVVFKKSELLVDACRFYFIKLYSLYEPIYIKQTKDIIFIIIANELSKIQNDIFDNATFTRLAFHNLKENVTKYYKTDIKIYE